MGAIFWIGSALGALVGLLHGIQIYRQQSSRASAGTAGSGRAIGLYYGLWTFALWTLFGSYVLIFWIVGLIGSSIARLLPRRRAA